MKQFLSFIKKEFYHIIRDYRTLLVLIGMPVVQIVLFGFALTTEVKNNRVAIFDQSQDVLATQLIQEIGASQYFDLQQPVRSASRIEQVLQSGQAKAVMVIPADFGDRLLRYNEASVQMITDGNDPNLATAMVNYSTAIIADFQSRINQGRKLPYTINTTTRMLYNPQLKGEYNFVPGVMALVLMLICTMMTAVAIVREKEQGNMEILLVSPMRPVWVVLSKAVPYLLLSLIILSIILVLSVALLQLPIHGSLLLLYGVSLVFIVAALALGLFISSITATQLEAMLVSLMGLMLPTLMFSGFMFPIESMALPLQWISNIVPAKWYFMAIKAIMIKGLGLAAIWKETLILSGFALGFLMISLAKFKTRLA